MNPLLDSEFLVKLNNDKNRTIYAHVISLNQYEHPIEQLEGVVTAGSITIDGESAVRRVCSLTLSAKNLNINNVYWGLTTKIKIEIGLQNNKDSKYEDIVWFPQGIFILTDFKTTQTINNYTINLTGKDKMCMLNGDVSGNFPAPIRFDSYTYDTNQSYTLKETDKGFYNNFIDDAAYEAVLEGFQDQYGSDFQYIQGAKHILTLKFKTNNIDNINNIKIKFSQNQDFQDLSALLVEAYDENKTLTGYEITLGTNDIYGFIVTGCSTGDQFIWTIEQKIPIAMIIREMLHQFGQERYSNIIIKDLDPYGLEMLDNAYGENYYLLHDGTIYREFVSQSDFINEYEIYGNTNANEDNAIKEEDGIITNIVFRNYIEEDDISLIEILSGSTLEKEKAEATKVIHKDNASIQYTVQPIYDNNVAGYGMTLLVYPDDLTAQVGDSITSILDKIVNLLGSYEYFYDLKGQFVFQAKPAYIKTAWNSTIYLNSENYVEPSELVNKVAYTFDDSTLTTQYQNTPNMNNIKNDYIIWGEKKNLSNSAIKFHGRYAIDNIPLEYTDFAGYTWTSNRQESLLQAIQQKREEASEAYVHQYVYPAGYTPEESEWWEINDWAYFYQSVFGVDLADSAIYMNRYHTELTSEDKQTALNIFKQGFLQNYNSQKDLNNGTDVITITYKDETKTEIQSIYCHGSCTHYYVQFMNIETAKPNSGWYYDRSQNTNTYAYLKNSFDNSLKYPLEGGTKQLNSFCYDPKYTTSFIYRPILPTDMNIYSSSVMFDIVYPNAVNRNGHKREYALPYDVDWRHLIHVMADDWYQHHTEDDYEINLRLNNSWESLGIDLFPYGRTNYEQYYLEFTSIGGLWQNIYNIYEVQKDYYMAHAELLTNEYHLGKYNQALSFKNGNEYFTSGAYKYWHKDVIENPEHLTFWFDFFRADEMGIGKFAVSVIGDRPKTINDSTIKTIIYRDTPDVIYCTWGEYLYYKERFALKDGYKYIIIGDGVNFDSDFLENVMPIYEEFLAEINDNGLDITLFADANSKDNQIIEDYNEKLAPYGINIYDLVSYNEKLQKNDVKQNFVRSIRSKTVHEQADNMLYQYSYYNDTVNISSVPVYYLSPNTIISTKDELSRVTGYYITNKINISLAYNGMMQITAIKTPERIY